MNFDVLAPFFAPSTFSFVVLPILIFLFRIVDQSIGTIRLIFAAKGLKYLTPVFAFFESFIWLLAIGQIMKHVDNIFCYVAFAGGFAAGNFFGIMLEERLSIGIVVVRIIPRKDSSSLITYLRTNNYRVTVVDVEGIVGPTKMIFTTVKRKIAPKVIAAVKRFDPKAFYTIDEVRKVSEGYFGGTPKKRFFSNLNPFRKRVRT